MRFLLSLCLSLSLLTFASSGRPLTQSADTWPQFRANPLLTGVAGSVPPANLKLLWTYEAGDSVESSAAILDGTVFVGSMSGDLHAVDLASGRAKWKYRTAADGIGESSPAVAGGVVYIGDLTGTLHAVNAGDGKRLWTYKTQGEIRSSPVIVGDRVLIGSYDGNLYCLGARNGTLLWKFKTNNYVHCTPSVVAGVAYIAGCDEVFRGIRISDGRQVMRCPRAAILALHPQSWARWSILETSIMKSSA